MRGALILIHDTGNAFMPSRPAATTNQLLAAFPSSDHLRFVSACERVELDFGTLLSTPGEPVPHVYFPTGGFISLVAPVQDHSGLEVGLIGDEGMFGISAMLGVDVSALHAIVQGAGPALRMSSARFRDELQNHTVVHDILKRYLHVVLCQLAQTAACTHFHPVEQRLARWLLMTADRAHGEAFHITHSFLAYMLGVRRVGVTNAASALQARHLIRYHRGDIKILDRTALEAVSCHCYAKDKATYALTMAPA
jgi:CRP-like cAMP-binding protein